MESLADRIAQAERRAVRGRRIVELQRQLIADGDTSPHAYEVLATFERSVEIFEEDLARLLKQRDARDF
jgi:hypothetical protein